MSGLISHSIYIAKADFGPRGPRYIGPLLYSVCHSSFYTPQHDPDVVLWYHVGCPCIRLSYVHPYFCFQMITSKYWWLFTLLCVCIDIVEIWFGIFNGQILSIFDRVVCPRPIYICMITLVNINGFSPNLVCVLILWRSAFGLLMGKYHPFWTELSARNTSLFYFQDN